MRKAEYLYPKMKSATSYQKLLARRVEELKLLGALIEVKEYSARPPAWSIEVGGWTGSELKKLETILIVIKNKGKNGSVAASTYITRDHYFKTVKTSDRQDADVLQASVNSLLEHIDEFTREKADQRALRSSARRNRKTSG